MNEGIRMMAKILNKLLHYLGIRITRVQSYGRLDIYPEKERPEQPLYINIGAGAFYHPYWHNLDTPNEFYAKSQKDHIHIQYDLTSRKQLPFLDNSLKAVYISHVIEHLSDDHVQYCFTEVHRCLQQGGFFRITCPDIDFEYDAYCRGDLSVWMWPTPWGARSFSIEQRFLEHFATILTFNYPDSASRKYSDEEIRDVFSRLPKEEALDYFITQIPMQLKPFYPENHINWFNVIKLMTMLRKAGFESIYDSRYGQSKTPIMRNTRLFDSTVPEISLYVECQK